MLVSTPQKGCRLVVFTDLDGTLLDHDSYSFEPALPALAVLTKHAIPLVVCTSKTRAEIEPIRVQLDNRHPFISENGGGVFIPKNYFHPVPRASRKDPDYCIIELGTPYKQLREAFQMMRAAFPGQLRGFGDCTPEEIAHLCNFSLSSAVLARKREYDEPFVAQDGVSFELLQSIADRFNLSINRGGRFNHLTGRHDKGKAVQLLRDRYRHQCGDITVIALGDSYNDLPMLEAADYPVLVKKPDGSYDSSIGLDNLILSRSSGPSGWCETLLELLATLGAGC